MKKPLVSVIMSVYNCEKFVAESIESVIKQGFKDFELIVYDDCSTDNTRSIVEECLKDSGIRYTMKYPVIGERLGCGQGRNKAIDEARGKYIAIQDGDDISFSHRLAKLVEFLEANDDIFCVGGFGDKMKANGDFIELMTYPELSHEKIYNDIMVNQHNNIIDPSCMFRKSVFDKLGGYSNRWPLVPDFNLWIRAAQEGYRFANIPDVIVHYRRHINSVTSKHLREAVREHRNMCKELIKGL